MATIFNPITLPASKMISTMTALISDMRFNDTLSPSDIVNQLVDSSRIGKVDFGKGIIYNFKVDNQPVKDLSETSSAFTITKPNIGQETIFIDNYKFVPISTSELLGHDAFTDGYQLNEFYSFVMSLLEDTAQFYLFDVVNNLYQTWTPTRATQTIQVNQINTASLTGTDLNAALSWNASEIGRVMHMTLNNMKVKNNKYTDLETYNDVNGGGQRQVISALRADNMKIVFNDKYWTNFMADAMASLYHSEKIGDMIPGREFVLLPTDSMTEENENTIAFLSDRSKFALADFYRVVMGIVDPSTTYTNTFYHFAYGAGVFKYAPGVKFVAKYIDPPSPGGAGGEG